MTAAQLITDARQATGDVVEPYKQSDAMYTEWLKDAMLKVALERPDAYTGYSASDLTFDVSALASVGGTLVINDKFRPAMVGWLIHRAGIHGRNNDLRDIGAILYKDGVRL